MKKHKHIRTCEIGNYKSEFVYFCNNGLVVKVDYRINYGNAYNRGSIIVNDSSTFKTLLAKIIKATKRQYIDNYHGNHAYKRPRI